MIRDREISLAVRRTLIMSSVATAGVTSLPAPAQAQDQPNEQPITTVTVTGSRIRRVDVETASPVYVIDSAAIQQSGVSTVGELIMQLPTVAGAATNPSVNNGGGFGESYIELRGLDAKRTLILVDGRRLGLIGDPGSGTAAVDVNQIPVSIIDHVEVLKEGAGAIYGSDAIAGVVNFITRKDVNGLEANGEFGKTSKSDGERRVASLMWGTKTDKFDFMISGNYHRQDPVSEGNRDFSKFALYLYSGSIVKAGSSRTPTGRIFLPAGSALRAQFGCSSVTKKSGAAGSSLSDYRCWQGAPDRFNYAPYNLLLTPQERGAIFSKVNYQLNDSISVYSSLLYNRTRSGHMFAPLPFDSVADGVVISKNNVYNPFGIDFGGASGANPQAEWRLLGLGTRDLDATSDSKLVNLGVKGKLFDTGWEWDLFGTYGRIDQTASYDHYLLAPLLSPAFGPSFIDATGPHCGTPGNVIPGCVPVNIFHVNDPAVNDPAAKAALNSVSTNYNTDHTYTSRSVSIDLTGKVFSMPAGDAQASVGAEYRYQEGIFTADASVQAAPPLFSSCLLAQETCTGNSRTSYNNKELYGELFLPLLKDLPAVHALNVDAGIRLSSYSIFKNTTKAQFKLEYRPISDLLVRGTFAQVFRAPTIRDLAQAPASTNPTFIDPCVGLTAAQVAANPNLSKACANVPTNGTFAQANGQISEILLSNPNLAPETGHVSTYGVIYDPSWLSGFSASVDFWRYQINAVITQADPTFSIDQCITTGSNFYCGLVTRYGAGPNAGQIFLFAGPTLNLGTLKTNGLDVGFKYTLRNSPIGSFRFNLDATHIGSYVNDPGGVGTAPVEYVGTYSRQFGNDMKWRGLASVSWAWQGFDALATLQYLGQVNIPSPDGAPNDGTHPNRVANLHIGSFSYLGLTLGYNFPTKTRIQAGVQNITDKQPPIFYQNNVINANTDVQTYDVIGRRWFVGFTQKF